MKNGFILPLLILIPNIIWMIMVKDGFTGENEKMIVTVLENVGRIGVFLIPCFLSLHFKKKFSYPALGAMLFCLLVYYICWGRYFFGGMDMEYFYKPFLFIPYPLAVMPVLFFIISAYPLSSWLMLGVSVYFGIFHVFITASNSV